MDPEKRSPILQRAEKKESWLVDYDVLVSKIKELDNIRGDSFLKDFFLDLVKRSHTYVSELELLKSNPEHKISVEEDHSGLQYQFDGFFKNVILFNYIHGTNVDLSMFNSIKTESSEISRAKSGALAIELVYQDALRKGSWFE